MILTVLTIVAVVGSFGPSVSWAQEPARNSVTADGLVARALTANPELRAARAAIEAAKGRLRQAGLRPNPMLDLSGTQNATGTDNMQMIGLSWPLDLGGRKDARVAVAARELAVKQAEVADRERRLAAEVRVKAGAVLGAARDVRVTDDLLAANRQTEALIHQRVTHGATPALDEQLLRVEVTRLEAQRAGQIGRLESLRLQLMPLVGLAAPAPLGVTGDLEGPLTLPEAATAIDIALQQRPDLRMGELEERLAAARVEKERADGRVDASLFGQYQRQETGFDVKGFDSAGRLRPIMDPPPPPSWRARESAGRRPISSCGRRSARRMRSTTPPSARGTFTPRRCSTPPAGISASSGRATRSVAGPCSTSSPRSAGSSSWSWGTRRC